MSEFKYKEGDRVRIKSIDWYNANKDEDGDVLCFYGVHKFTKEMSKFCDKTVTISTNLTDDGEYSIKEDDETDWWTDDMIECKVEDVLLDDYEELTDRAFKGGYEKCKSDIELNGFQLPDGYQFVDENGNEILASKIILKKKKKEYPNTYVECCRVLGVSEFEYNHTGTKMWYRHRLMATLDNLILCRDAYWQIAGAEMGLDDPWEPDWESETELKYTIVVDANKVCEGQTIQVNTILAFPTAEMRDAFKKNFDQDIEICKEFL